MVGGTNSDMSTIVYSSLQVQIGYKTVFVRWRVLRSRKRSSSLRATSDFRRENPEFAPTRPRDLTSVAGLMQRRSRLEHVLLHLCYSAHITSHSFYFCLNFRGLDDCIDNRGYVLAHKYINYHPRPTLTRYDLKLRHTDQSSHKRGPTLTGTCSMPHSSRAQLHSLHGCTSSSWVLPSRPQFRACSRSDTPPS